MEFLLFIRCLKVGYILLLYCFQGLVDKNGCLKKLIVILCNRMGTNHKTGFSIFNVFEGKKKFTSIYNYTKKHKRTFISTS